MSVLNAASAAAVNVLLASFSSLPPLVGLSVASLVTAAVMLLVFKRTSDQVRLSAVKRSIHAALFEVRLYNDDLRAIMRAQLEILRHNVTYLRLSLMPMLWVIVPLVLVIAQMQSYYGYAPLHRGDRVILKVKLRNGPAQAMSLETPPALPLDTPAVWLPAAKEVLWRVHAANDGGYEVRVKIGSEIYTKSVQIAGGVVRRSPMRLESSLVNQVLYPSESPLPRDGPVTAITVAYPEADIAVLGWELNWMVVYFALSLIFAFALRKPFGVTV